MENTKMKSILTDPDYYTKMFQVYAKKSNKFSHLVNWTEEVFPKMVLEKLRESFSAKTQINMLGIGTGSGEMDRKMAASINAHFKSVRNVVVEPAKRQLEIYHSALEETKSEFSGIDFDLRQMVFDKYREQEGKRPPKYHFISAIQSIYYIDDINDTLRYLYDCLEDGGVMLITTLSDMGGFRQVWSSFPQIQDVVGPYPGTNDIRKHLSDLNIPFEENLQKSQADITSCFQEGSKEGQLIIDFLSQIIDLRGTAPSALYREVVEKLGSDQCSERKADGTVLLNNDWDAFVVYK
ncbi:histamine N-methyltransferase B-like [Lytechinus variegatus]|uniref:histamine N-methyltransferase B-like n=1 Tax=Lytechinus variegatus TaxID=7654 RepID=UPI001BB2CA33|nr:histamine N-methyltransferase B-like [Lytechinus variegatus]